MILVDVSNLLIALTQGMLTQKSDYHKDGEISSLKKAEFA